MHAALEGLKIWQPPETIVGIETFDDAGVYRISDSVALVQTVDFFTPIVDDPGDFGRIAMANALSDVYAKGAQPITALNVLCVPVKDLPPEDLNRVLQGAADKLREAKVALLGGHTVTDTEFKFGAAVTGLIDPKMIWTNAGARRGDRLVLTKPLGVGILTTALRSQKISEEDLRPAVESMCRLNEGAMQAARAVGGIHACTDITGFGLAGHAAQMALASEVTFRISVSRLPIFPGAEHWGAQGVLPRGARNNRSFLEGRYRIDGQVRPSLHDILFDPVTSGGLFFSVESARAERLVLELRRSGYPSAIEVGEVTSPRDGLLVDFVP